MGPVRFLVTTEFEPTADGTVIHERFAAPKTAKERAIVEQMRPWLDDVMHESTTRLKQQLDAEVERRAQEATGEPDVPPPRSDGVLASMPPTA
jgi:hypothetical protein